ncbi:uncharacterized protein VTP21DRAFT_6761 [Calcarisporiella thermophila]|uniref:uncharacterized protein n=1 Tax=Calcarisporiella thermophila TaxID=911321 RepID=UPI0037425A76
MPPRFPQTNRLLFNYPRRFYTSTSNNDASRIVLSGIQATGTPHLGNYLGALSSWVNLQFSEPSSTRIYTMIADAHSITVPQNPSELRKKRREVAIALLAVGLKPERCIIFEQSRILEHAQLAWILNCITPVGWLNRMTQWKSKAKMLKERSEDAGISDPGMCLGLFAYPVLQAADILLYNTTHVPVGEDQIQHLELTRDIADMFNRTTGKDIFSLPSVMISNTKRIKSLRNPAAKMSKSDPVDASRINLTDTKEQIGQKIRRATTDSTRGITYDPTERPAVSNLVTIYAAMRGCGVEEVCREHADSSHADFKEALTIVIEEKIGPIRENIHRLNGEKAYVDQVLKEGAEKASEVASRTLRKAMKAIGLD